MARANGVTAALSAPTSGQSALIRLTGTSADELVLKAPVALHLSYPSGRPPFDLTRLSEEPERKTFEERQKEKKKNQEKELRKLAHLLDDAKAYAAALEATGKAAAEAPKPDLPRQALAPFARGEAPVILRADEEEEIRGAVAFAKENGLEAHRRGRPRGLALHGRPQGQRRAGAAQRPSPARPPLGRLRRRLHGPPQAARGRRALRHRLRRHELLAQSALRGRHGPGLRPARRGRAARDHAVPRRDLRSRRSTLGSIEAGKDATLFLASGDIMDHRTRVLRVFIDGKEQSLETRHTRLYEEFKDRR